MSDVAETPARREANEASVRLARRDRVRVESRNVVRRVFLART